MLYMLCDLVSFLWLFIGHNWGSEHDPDTDSCAPSSSAGGRFIMYPSAVSGYEKNNQVSLCLILTRTKYRYTRVVACRDDRWPLLICRLWGQRLDSNLECLFQLLSIHYIMIPLLHTLTKHISVIGCPERVLGPNRALALHAEGWVFKSEPWQT